MADLRDVIKEINALISFVLEQGLADDQNSAIQRNLRRNEREVVFHNAHLISVALRDLSYDEIYSRLLHNRSYNVRMLDGALIQMMYTFRGDQLRSHRLGFFPSPNLEEFQNNPEIYLEDDIYADVVSKNVVPFPFRLDYSSDRFEGPVDGHPSTHLTLGQYENCRIPVTRPMNPASFMDFVLRNFYHTAYSQYANLMPRGTVNFPKSILPPEQLLVHIVVPGPDG